MKNLMRFRNLNSGYELTMVHSYLLLRPFRMGGLQAEIVSASIKFEIWARLTVFPLVLKTSAEK